MAVRTVNVLLTADITAFRARMNDASRQSRRTSNSIRTSMRNAGRTLTRVGENQRNALKMVQGASIGLLAAFGFAVAASAKFEKAMASVKAVTQASAAEMGTLRAAAMEAGRTTQFSASEAANGMFELAKAGISVADIAGGALKGSLSLAAAAQVDLAKAAEISANAMTVFGLEGKDVGHVADVLAAAANKSTTDVHQLGMSLRMTGLVAAQTGLSIEDTVGSLALFASEGMKGSDAGTSFKVMLQRLTPQSKEAKNTMDALGFSAYDANGEFVGLHEMARRMKEAFSGLTPEARNAAMGVIFGSDAVRAASILYKHGEEGVRKYTDAVDAQGYASAVAATKMDHLLGDLDLLKSALETALIESGSAANSALRDMVQWVTRLVNIYNALPPGLQRAAGLLTGLVGILGLAGASMLLLLPRIMLVRRELVDLGVTAARVRGALLTLSKLGLVLGTLAAIGWGISQLVDQFGRAPANVTKLTNSLVDLAQRGKTAGEVARVFGSDLDGFGEAVARIAHPTALNRVKDFFSTFDPGDTDLDRARKDVEALDESLASMVQSGAPKVAADAFKEMAKAAEANGTSTEKLRTLLPKYNEALAATDTQTKLTAGSQGALGDETAMTADEMEDQRSEAEKLSDALKSLNGAAISAAEGEINFRESLATLTETVKENGTSLDVTSEKGRAVKGAFLDAAKAAMSHAEAVSEQMGSQEAGNAVLEKNIGALRRSMKQAGFTDKQIRELTNAYAQLPSQASTKVTVPGAIESATQIDRLDKEVRDLKPGKTITIKAPTAAAIKELRAAGFNVKKIPGSKKVKITAPTGTAQANARALKRAIDALRSKSITITTTRIFRSVQAAGGSNQAAKNAAATLRAAGGPVGRGYASGGRVLGFPGGGFVAGPGTSTSDSIPAWLSNGEYVIRAAAVRRYGMRLFHQLNGMQAPTTVRRSAVLSGARFTGNSTPVGSRRTMLGDGGPMHIHLSIGDRKLGEVIIDPLRYAVHSRGGDVQAVIGRRRGRS